MAKTSRASNLWTAALALYTAAAPAELTAKSRCEADLSRVDNAFCLSDQHTTAAGGALSYQWSANDQTFSLSSKVCLSAGGQLGARRDLVLALDRSQNMWGVDSAQRKQGADQISTARYIIERLASEAKANPAAAPKLGLMMFSSDPACTEYVGGPIAVAREFPCLFVPARVLSDDAHVQQLLGFLMAADGKYSQGGLSATSLYSIVADTLANDRLALQSPASAGLVLFSDGRTYRGEPGDVYTYLRSGAYRVAQDEAKTAFAQPAMTKYKLLFALSPVSTPLYDTTHSDAYDNMCALPNASVDDCDPARINFGQPSTWPVNNLDFTLFATALANATGGGSQGVVPLIAKEALDPALDQLRNDFEIAPVDAVSFSVNGGARQPGSVLGSRIAVDGLPTGQALGVDLFIQSRGAEIAVPLKLTTAGVTYDGKDFLDREMFCQADVASATEDPNLRLSDLQGGSASCGVVGGASSSSMSLYGLIMLLPLLGVFALAGFLPQSIALLLALSLGAVIFVSEDAAAEEAKGLNALQYRPVTDGVGSTERAVPLAPGQITAGLFIDYANDAVELGGAKGKRQSSVMDDLVTTHATLGVGLADRLSIGAHIPYVHKTDVERDIDGEEIEGGQLGRPADAAVMVKIAAVRRSSWAFGVMPMVTIPTGDPEYLLGDGSSNYGAMLLFSGTENRIGWATSVGYLQREKPLELEDDRASTIVVRGHAITQAGVGYRLLPALSLAGNLQVKISAGDRVDLTRSNPAEWSTSLKFKPTPGLALSTSFGTGLGKGYGSPDYRVVAGVSYVPEAQQARRSVAARK